MLFQKNTLKFNSFSKGWIPSTEVFPNGNPNDSATDIVNFDVDSVKGGLVKTNGYVVDGGNYSNSLSGLLTNPDLIPDHVIKHIHNFSVGVPLQADLLLAVAYQSAATTKYKWLIRDMILNDILLSNPDYYYQEKWYNLLLSFNSTVVSSGSSGDVTEIHFTIDETATASDILDDDGFLLPYSLDGFIVKIGSAYRTVVYTGQTDADLFVKVTPSINATGTITFYRSRLSLLATADFNSIFNPSSEYSAFIVNNIMSKMMIGLGKEVQPLWMGYINKHYFYNKTNSVYLLDNVGISCQRNVVLDKRIPEFDIDLTIGYSASDGTIESATEIELAVTACFDGYQEVVPTTVQGTASNKKISLKLTVKNNGNSLFSGQVESPVTGIFHSGFYLKLLEGTTEIVEIRFIDTTDWNAFIDNINLGANPNKIWIKADYNNDLTNDYSKINQVASYIFEALRQGERSNGILYVGSFTWADFVASDLYLAKDNTDFPTIYLTSATEMVFTTGSEWKIESNARYHGLFTTDSDTVVQQTSYVDTYQFNDGEIAPVIDENFFVVKLPNSYNAIDFTLKVDLPLFNRRITSYSIWGRYKPDIDSIGKWLIPFYQLKKIYVNDTNIVLTGDDEYESGANAGWYFDSGDLLYQTRIKKIYGNELEGIDDTTQISEELQTELSNLKDIPQLLATLKYEPSVGIAAKYGAATIHNNIAWIADTDDKVEVLRFSRVGSTGTNNLDVFSYDFDSSIGFELIGQDSPGHITALASKDDELIVLRDNSFFSIKTGIETISVKQGGNYVGCKYPRSVVTSKYGVIFADDNGIWLYQGLSSGSMNVIQINWQWDNYYKNILQSDKTSMFASWNGKTEEYWLMIKTLLPEVKYTIYIADFKNMQSLDQSMALMKDKEKVLVPWRKKVFNSTAISDFTIDSYGGLIFADAGAVYFDDLSVFSMASAAYNELYVDSKIITQHSPMLKVYEVLTETLKDAVNDWKFNIKLFVNESATARQTIKMFGNCTNQENLICVRPVNLGNALNDISMRVDMGANTGPGDNTSGNGTTVKKLRAFGLNVLTRKEKYVSE
jgi:hypothetical protein